LDEDLIPTPFFIPSSWERVLMGFSLVVDALWAPFGGFQFFLLGFLVPSTSSLNSFAFESSLSSKNNKNYVNKPCKW